jgi:Ca2+-binding RTX toxin-like protein
VSSFGTGIVLYGDGPALINKGEIAGGGKYAVLTGNGTDTVKNYGYIFGVNTDGDVAFQGTAGGMAHGSFENWGFVSGAHGVLLQDSDATIHNYADGLIKTTYSAVTVTNAAGVSDLFNNAGEISGGSAFMGGAGNETIVNSGKITGDIDTYDGEDSLVMKAGSRIDGDVDLGDGNDTLDLRHGALGKSNITGGGGDDIYLVNKDGIAVTEGKGGGDDTVDAGVSYHLGANFEHLNLAGHGNIDGVGNAGANRVYGNTGDNHLSGGKGDDVLSGMSGSDRLTGGGGDDFFVFGKGWGQDAIADFHEGEDRINLHYVGGIGSFADIMLHATQHGSSVEFDFGDGDVLTIAHTDLGSLKDGDFIY